MDVKAAMDRARRMGFHAIDVGATSGPVSPGELSRSGRRHLLKHLESLGLRLGSLRGPAAGPGYADPAGGERRLDTMRRIIAFAGELGVPVVSTTPGLYTAAGEQGGAGRLGEALGAIAAEADHWGVRVAVETCGIRVDALRDLLSRIDCPLLAACCDSGAMLMQGEDPHAVGEDLAGRLGLVRARDAVAGTAEGPGYEVACGQGSLDAGRLLAALDRGGFDGDLVLTRTSGMNPAEDLLAAQRIFGQYLR
jgi:sugar phosphate isomerase/epimerase